MYPKPSIVPPGGFHWVEKHNGAEIKITGDSVENTASNLEKYRLTNGIPLGDPKKEIANYICTNWPHFCNGNDAQTFNEGQRVGPAAALATRVASWTTRLWNMGASNFVKDEEAQRRAQICTSCEMNSDFRAGGCGGCVQGIDRLVFTWLSRRILPDLKVWHSLKACRATGAHLQASIFADKQPDASPEEQLQYSPQCWRR